MSLMMRYLAMFLLATLAWSPVVAASRKVEAAVIDVDRAYRHGLLATIDRDKVEERRKAQTEKQRRVSEELDRLSLEVEQIYKESQNLSENKREQLLENCRSRIDGLRKEQERARKEDGMLLRKYEEELKGKSIERIIGIAKQFCESRKLGQPYDSGSVGQYELFPVPSGITQIDITDAVIALLVR